MHPQYWENFCPHKQNETAAGVGREVGTALEIDQ